MRLIAWIAAGQWRLQPGRAVLTIAAIAIGVALGLAIHLVNRSALEEFGRALAVVNGEAQARVVATAGSFEEALYPRIATEAAVLDASPSIELEIALQHPSDASPRTLRVIGLDVFRAAQVTPSLLPSPAHGQPQGSSSTLFDDDALFLSAAAQSALGLRAGQRIELRAPDGSSVSLRITGDVPGAAPGQRLAVMDLGAMQWRFGWLGRLNRIDLKLAESGSISALGERLAASLGTQARLEGADAAAQRMSNLSRAYRVNLGVLSLVALFTGVFIVGSTLSLAVARQRATLAMLGILGASRRWLLSFVLLQGATVGLLGGLLGLVLGIAAAAGLLDLVGGDLGGGYFHGSRPELVLDAWALAGFACCGILAGLAGSLRPALALRRASALAAVRDSLAEPQGSGRALPASLLMGLVALALLAAPTVGGLPWFAYASIALCLLAGIVMIEPLVRAVANLAASHADPLLLRPSAHRPAHPPDHPPSHPPLRLAGWLATQRLAHAPRRATAALAGVVASVALASAMAIMVGSFRHSVGEWLDAVLPADLYGRARSADTALDDSLRQRIDRQPGIARVAYGRLIELSLAPERPSIVLIARPIDADAPQARLPFTGPVVDAQPGAVAIYISEAMVDLYGWQPGQQVSLPIGDGRARLLVRGVWRDYARQHGSIAIDLEDYRRLSGDRSVNDVALWLAPGTDSAEMVRQLAGDPTMALLEWRSVADLRRRSMRIFDRSFAVTYALEAVALLVGLFGVTATFASEALSRRREFGLMRHLGTTRSQNAWIIGIEALALLTLGVLWGLVLGMLIAWILVARVNPQSFHWTMQMHWPIGLLATGSAMMIAAGVSAAMLAARQAMSAAPVRAVREDW